MRFNMQQYHDFLHKQKKRKNKYFAVENFIDGQRFPSLAEGGFYKVALRMREIKEISFFLRQVPFHLPGGIKMVLDFLIFYPCGRIRFIDIKGCNATRDWINKKKQVEEIYGVKIEIIVRAEVLKLMKQYAVS